MSRLSLTFTSPEVVSVRGVRGIDGENHVDWYVDFAPEPEEGVGGRVVFGTIHAVHEGVGADVTVASLVKHETEAEPTNEEFEAALVEAEATETLWDVSRLAFGAVGGMLGNRAELPRKAPEAAVGMLSRPGEPESESDIEDDD